jgi:hypothetical protein
MTQDLTLNQLLKEIWKLDEKIMAGEILTDEEKKFYNENLPVIVKYYSENCAYWMSKKPL